MTIGDVIRTYRKKVGLTQEEMAKRLGVTAPAVNKWENNNTLPDVALLAPISRLLGITTDILLGFQENLSAEEISAFIRKMNQDLDTRNYEEVFKEAKEKIELYPNCELLIWQTAVILHARLSIGHIAGKNDYAACSLMMKGSGGVPLIHCSMRTCRKMIMKRHNRIFRGLRLTARSENVRKV